MSQMIDINKLKINKYYWQPVGPRRMARYRKDIMENGIREPLLLDKDGKTIVDGIIRFKIAKELGFTQLPCKIIGE